ncbi:MAG: hypothetical protein ABII72_03040, partial [Parcubacteria group bacterium]
MRQENISPRDQNTLQDEISEEKNNWKEYLETNIEEYKLLISKLDDLIQEMFPEERKNYYSPDFKRLESSFRMSLDPYQNTEIDSDQEKFEKTKAFTTAAAIRFVDNFLDEALWPRLKSYQPDVIKKKIDSYLERSLEILRE